MENDYILLKRIRDILFFVFCTIFILFLSFFVYIDCHALAVGQSPDQIKLNYNNTTEYFNIVNDGSYFSPYDAGNQYAYFNYLPCNLNFSNTSICPLAHYHPADNVDFRFSGTRAGTYTVFFNLYYTGYEYYYDGFPGFLPSNDPYWIPDNLDTFAITNIPDIAYYNTNNQVAFVTPKFQQGSNLNGSGTWLYTYKAVIVDSAGSYVWIKSRPYTSNLYNKAFRTGISIDIVEGGVVNDDFSDLIDNDNSNTQSIIQNILGLPGKIVNGLSYLFQNIVTAITSLPGLIWNAFSSGFTAVTTAIGNVASSIWNLFSGAFTTLFGWLSNILNALINILSDDTPTSEWLSNYISNFPGINENIIAQIITLPIHILTKLIGVNTCAPVILGNMYGTTLTLPCLSTILSNILGSLINIVGWMVAFYIYYIMFVKIKDLLFEMLTLEGNVARKMKIKF